MQNPQQVNRPLATMDGDAPPHWELQQALEFALMLADNSGQRLIAARISQIIELLEHPNA